MSLSLFLSITLIFFTLTPLLHCYPIFETHFIKSTPPSILKNSNQHQYFEITHPLFSDFLSPTCTTLVLNHSFADTIGKPPVTADYFPPSDCDWSYAVLEFSASCVGDQYDRIVGIWLDGVELLRTSTAEPTEDGVFWKVRKDVTRYSSLLSLSGIVLTVMLENVVNNVYTGIYNVNVSILYYMNPNDVPVPAPSPVPVPVPVPAPASLPPPVEPPFPTPFPVPQPSESVPVPEPSEPVPVPEPSEPPVPQPSEPVPEPQPFEPVPMPQPFEPVPAPVPQPFEPVPVPQPFEPVPVPQPFEPVPMPQPSESVPVPQPSEPVPMPQPSESVPVPQPSESVPEPSESVPIPEPSEPVPVPQPSEPVPVPQPSEPVPMPQPSKPIPVPQPSESVPVPQPSESVPVPQPSEPSPASQPSKPIPVPQPSEPVPVPQPPEPSPAPQPFNPVLAPVPTPFPIPIPAPASEAIPELEPSDPVPLPQPSESENHIKLNRKFGFDIESDDFRKNSMIASPRATESLHYYSDQNMYKSPADLIIPISANGNEGFWFRITNESVINSQGIQIPKNTYKAVLEVYVSFHGDDEFWYSNPPDSYIEFNNLTTGRGGGAYREVLVTIDGNLVGSVFPFPVIFTGGINPLFWEPVVAIGAFNLPSYDFLLTPFLGQILDGKEHVFGLGVADSIQFWLVDANLHLWFDHTSSEVQAKSIPYRPSTLEIERKSKFKQLDGKFKVEATRKSEYAGWVNSSTGNFTTYITQKLKFKNKIKFKNNGTEKSVKQKIKSKIEIRVEVEGTVISRTTMKIKYPLEVSISNQPGKEDDTTLMLTSVEHGFEANFKGDNDFSASIDNEQKSNGWMIVKDHDVLSGSADTRQEYELKSDIGCYSRTISASNGWLLTDDSSYSCSSSTFF